MPKLTWVKKLPDPASFGKKKVRFAILPPAPSVLAVETNHSTGDIEVFFTDFVIRWQNNWYMKSRFRDDVLKKWEGKLASTTSYGEYIRRILVHNFERWSWANKLMKKYFNSIPKTLPKDYDFSSILEQIDKEGREFEAQDHHFRDIIAKSPAFGSDNPFLNQNPPEGGSFEKFYKQYEDFVAKLPKNQINIGPQQQGRGPKQSEKSTKTLDQIGKDTQKNDKMRKIAFLGGSSMLGGTAPYLYKSPFYIRDSVAMMRESFRVRQAQSLVQSSFSIAEFDAAEEMIPILTGLSGAPEIVGQPIFGAFISGASLLAHSEFSELHKTGGQKKSFSEKITQEELNRRIAQHLKKRRGLFWGAQKETGDAITLVETEKEREARVKSLEAYSRAVSSQTLHSLVETREAIVVRLLENLKTRPVSEQLTFYLYTKYERMNAVRNEFHPQYFAEFEKLPKIHQMLIYRDKICRIDDINIKIDTHGKKHYMIVAKPEDGGKTIYAKFDEMYLEKPGWWKRPTLGFRHSLADIARFPVIEFVATSAVALWVARFIQSVQNKLGWTVAGLEAGKKLKGKKYGKVSLSLPGSSRPDPVLLRQEGVRPPQVQLGTGPLGIIAPKAINAQQYQQAAWWSVFTAGYIGSRSANLYESFVSYVIEGPEPYELAYALDTALPLGSRSYVNAYTEDRITTTAVSESIRELANSTIKPFVDAYEGTKDRVKGFLQQGADTMKALFNGVIILVSLSILYKVVS